MIESVRGWSRKIGKAHLLHHLEGGSLPLLQSIYAKCYACTGGEERVCTVTDCPLLPHSQFQPIEENAKTKKRKGTSK